MREAAWSLVTDTTIFSSTPYFKKKEAHVGNRGVSLIELVIGIALGGIVIFFGAQSLNLIGSRNKHETAMHDLESDSKNIGIFLKQKLEGGKSFQNVLLRIPAATPLISRGPGFVIEKDKDLLGNASPGNDKIYLVSSVDTAAYTKLATAFPPTLTVESLDTSVPVSKIFADGDLMAVTKISSTELLKIPAPTTIGTASSPFTLTAAHFAHTLSGSGFNYAYAAGDRIGKAQLWEIGIDNISHTLSYRIYGTSSTSVLARNIKSFQIGYNLGPETSSCPSPVGSTADDVYLRDDWDTLNTTASRTCYMRIRSVKFSFVVGKEPKSPTETPPRREDSYRFSPNVCVQ
jgi:hypothetical protein